MNHLTFSGHETFHCRHFWLKKGYDFLMNNHRFSEDSAVVELGVGKNVVTAIRYWMRAFEIIDARDELQKIASYLFADNGKDPYLENIGSLWLLHYFLVTRGQASIFSLVFNELRKERIEFNKEHIVFIETIKPFLTFYKELPVYPKKTKRLSQSALALREAIATATDPEKTFFDFWTKAAWAVPNTTNLLNLKWKTEQGFTTAVVRAAIFVFFSRRSNGSGSMNNIRSCLRKRWPTRKMALPGCRMSDWKI